MKFNYDETILIKQLSKGCVIPINQYNKDIIENLLRTTFTLNKNKVKLIKNYSIDLEDIFSATLDSRFKI